MPDLGSQLRAYAEHLDAIAPPLDELNLERQVVPVRPAPTWRMGRMVVTGVAVAVTVLIAVGVAALAFRTEAPPVTDTATTIAESTIAPAPVRLRLAADEPVIPSDGRAAGDGEPMRFTGPGGAVVDDGTYHLFLNHYDEDVSVVLHATSPNLLEWAVGSERLLEGSAVTGAEFGIRVRTAAQLPEGTWALYFDYETKVGEDALGAAIGIATAPAATGPWSVTAVSIVAADAAWRSGGAKHPSVVVTEEGLVMYFVGIDPAGVGRIGRATSGDGVTWQIDPAPVFEASEEWERGTLTLPNVVSDGERWVMLYAGRTPSGQGFVVSEDGIAWSEAPKEPVLTVSNVVRPQIRDSELLVTPSGELRLLLENGGQRTTSDVWLLEEVGP